MKRQTAEHEASQTKQGDHIGISNTHGKKCKQNKISGIVAEISDLPALKKSLSS